ncbi:MAG TPA: Trp biosynthesis-associated membrane protein [Micromonosporaceae bacterium]|nr:Trp biosynthesis-associated membrane protein [Micromonosporaceae bacterium]
MRPADEPGQVGPRARGRRELAAAVLVCLAGAGLGLYAATRVWAVGLTARPAPLPPLADERSGAVLAPWLPALALVALAGAGALVATRGAGRRAVAVLVLLVGVGLVAGGGYGLGGVPGVRAVWPAACLLGGVLVAGAGVAALRRGRDWPALDSRYDRRPPVTRGDTPEELWNALDRGEDPTVR